MDVTESDHKPVRCKLNVDIAHVDRSVRRQEFGKILESHESIKPYLEALRFVPETSLNTNKILLNNLDTITFNITNQSKEHMVFYQILCQGQCPINETEVATEYRPRGSLGFPRWLQVFYFSILRSTLRWCACLFKCFEFCLGNSCTRHD